MCFYSDNDDGFSRSVIRTARKVHRCEECAEEIQPGDTYRYIEGLSEGYFWAASLCARCHFVREAIAAVEISRGCGSWEAYPALGELREAWADGDYAIDLGIAVPIEPDDPEGGLTAPKLEEMRW
jgi:hypothetical protein